MRIYIYIRVEIKEPVIATSTIEELLIISIFCSLLRYFSLKILLFSSKKQ